MELNPTLTSRGKGSADKPARRDSPSPLHPAQRWLFGALLLVLLACKIVYALHFRIDADEPQHLHVVWGWATGQLPYRDFFDNHGPIFHLLFAPLFSALGERPDILLPMRLAMIPLCACSLWCVYRLGKALFSAEVGLWAVLLTGFYPEFLFTSGEFRTDNLWTAFWFFGLLVATNDLVAKKRTWLVGIFLGLAFGITVKTALMVGTIGLATLTLFAWERRTGQDVQVKSLFVQLVTGMGGFLIVPAALTAYFAAHGALREFITCNVTYNIIPKAQNWSRFDGHVLWFPIAVAICAAVVFTRKPGNWNLVTRQRAFIAFSATYYFTALKTFFPTLSRQDDLPFIPLVMIFIAAGFLALPRSINSPQLARAFGKFALPLVIVLEMLWMNRSAPLLRNDTKEEIAILAKALRAASPGEYVMDSVGETIFRKRPFYYALEAFTRVRMARGLTVDDISEHLIATTTAVVRPRGLTRKARGFVSKNYVKVANDLYILGKKLVAHESDRATGLSRFKIQVPGRYVIMNARGKFVEGTLDGKPFTSAQPVAAGEHVFVPKDNHSGRFALFWADASERGFIPFERGRP